MSPLQHSRELQKQWVAQQQPGISPARSAAHQHLASYLAQVGVALPPRRQAGAQLAGAAAAHLQREHGRVVKLVSGFTGRTAQIQQTCVACAHAMTPDSRLCKQAAWNPQHTHRLAHAARKAVAALGWIAAAKLHRAGIGALEKGR